MKRAHIADLLRRHDPKRRLLNLTLLLAGLLAGLFCVFTLMLLEMRRDTWRETVTASHNIVVSETTEVQQFMRIYDASLRSTALAMDDPQVMAAAPPLRQRALFNVIQDTDLLGRIRILDAEGQVVADSAQLDPPPASQPELNALFRHRHDTNEGSIISGPATATNGEHLVTLSRRITHPDGSFAGMVCGTIRLEYLTDRLRRLKLGPHDVVSLFLGSGVMLAHAPGDPTIGRRITGSEVMHRFNEHRSGSMVVLATDGVRRLFTFTHIDGWPLLFDVGVSVSDLYAPWRQKAVTIGVLLAAMAVGGGIIVFMLSREVTGRIDAEGEARRSEAQYRALADGASDIIMRFGPDLVRTYASPSVRTLGYEPMDLVGRTPADWICPHDQDAFATMLEVVRSGHRADAIRYRVRRRDGAYNWIEARYSILEDGEFVAVLRDIDARQRMEFELEERTRERDRLWRLARDPFLICNVEGQWLSINPVWTELLGWTPDELLGRTSDWIEHFDDRVSMREEIKRVAAGGDPRFEHRLRDSCGSFHWFSWTAIEDEGLIYCVARDITGERGQAEARELLEDQLRQSQKMEAVGRLSAGVAHDFNNILQGIVSALELAQDDIDEASKAYARTNVAINAAMRGSSLTHHLLSYARKQMLRPQAVPLAPLFDELQALLARTLGPQIALRAQAEHNLAVLADPGQLQTALLNLAINASHAMPNGGNLSIDAYPEVECAQSWVVIMVKDTGIGMDEATVAKATEPFFTTKGLDGSGLGLSMVQGFAMQSDGRLSIFSKKGEGTTIEIRLPQPTSPERVEGHPRSVTRQLPRRILLVDDSSEVLAMLGEVLEKEGLKVVQANNSADALATLNGGRSFDVIVSSFAMTGLSGSDLIAQAQLVQPGLKAVLITGFAEMDFVEMRLKGIVVLPKPFLGCTFLDALAELADNGAVSLSTLE
ncbi:MAG: PAS domain S-box protein [Janthinobacterium lividum]